MKEKSAASFVTAGLKLLVELFKDQNREQQLIPTLLDPGEDGRRRQRSILYTEGVAVR